MGGLVESTEQRFDVYQNSQQLTKVGIPEDCMTFQLAV